MNSTSSDWIKDLKVVGRKDPPSPFDDCSVIQQFFYRESHTKQKRRDSTIASQLSALLTLDLSGTGLTGSIENVDWTGLETSLTQLKLNNNALTGSIPTSLQNLKALASLDISSNKFNGPLPNLKSLSSQLAECNVSQNTGVCLVGDAAPSTIITNLLPPKCVGNANFPKCPPQTSPTLPPNPSNPGSPGTPSNPGSPSGNPLPPVTLGSTVIVETSDGVVVTVTVPITAPAPGAETGAPGQNLQTDGPNNNSNDPSRPNNNGNPTITVLTEQTVRVNSTNNNSVAPSADPANSPAIPMGAWIGMAVGVVLLIVLLTVGIFVATNKRRRGRKDIEPASTPYGTSADVLPPRRTMGLFARNNTVASAVGTYGASTTDNTSSFTPSATISIPRTPSLEATTHSSQRTITELRSNHSTTIVGHDTIVAPQRDPVPLHDDYAREEDMPVDDPGNVIGRLATGRKLWTPETVSPAVPGGVSLQRPANLKAVGDGLVDKGAIKDAKARVYAVGGAAVREQHEDAGVTVQQRPFVVHTKKEEEAERMSQEVVVAVVNPAVVALNGNAGGVVGAQGDGRRGSNLPPPSYYSIQQNANGRRK
ncbi:hypothetical protein HDU97_004442 [Phlyctochytrium planicorne]|nr:hypothetical protein HDU97_004442 [Phlyctochytrium planicorne]